MQCCCNFEVSYGFESIAIKQKKNINKSRLDVNTRSEIARGVWLDVPLIAANMSTVTNSDFCINLYKNGALGVMHRAAEEEYILMCIKRIKNASCSIVAGSIGVGDSQYKLAKKMVSEGCNMIFIDIAHGYSDYIIEFGRNLKKEFGEDIKIILGNTTNVEMLKEISDFADGLKVGIAQGFACETKNTAGCTEKQFSAVLKFKEFSKEYGIPIISDGGIREPADFVKAIGAGANSVMAGKIFAACEDSAAEISMIPTCEKYNKKIYAGMASEYVQNDWRGGLKEGTCAEGTVKYLDINGYSGELLKKYSGALKSGITYAGGSDISSFQKNVEFIRLA